MWNCDYKQSFSNVYFILCRIEAYEKRKTGIDFKSYTAPVKVNRSNYHIINRSLHRHLHWVPLATSN